MKQQLAGNQVSDSQEQLHPEDLLLEHAQAELADNCDVTQQPDVVEWRMAEVEWLVDMMPVELRTVDRH